PGGFFSQQANVLSLQPLGREDAELLLCAATDAAPLRPHVLDSMVVRAAGNPLFLEELLRIIDRPASADVLPDSLDTVVSTQIDRLDPASRRLVRAAAVLGHSFHVDTLQNVLAEAVDEVVLERDAELGRFLVAEGDHWRFP